MLEAVSGKAHNLEVGGSIPSSATNQVHTVFDNSKPNCIILSDRTDVLGMAKTLGPYKVASELRASGFEVLVIHHLHVFTLDEIKQILQQAVSAKTLFVGFNNFFYADLSQAMQQASGGVELGVIPPGALLPHGKQFNSEIKQLIKQVNPNCQLVLGGPTAYDNNDHAIFDYVVVGYAESSVVNLAKHLLDKSVQLEKSYKSVYGPVIVNDSRAEGYDFVNCELNYVDHDNILPGETLQFEIARGCIFKCAFCSYPLNGKKKLDFIRSKDKIYNELVSNYNKFGTTRYIFCDDTFNDSVEKCRMIYEISQQLPFKLEWWGYIRLDLMRAHPETIEWLFESGLRSALFGIETLNPETSKIVGKGGDRESLFAVVRKIKEKYGPKVNLHGTFIFGLPRESVESMQQTAEFLLSDQNPLDSWAVQPLNIKPANNNYSNDFLSAIDRDFAKFGYTNLGEAHSQGRGMYTMVKYPTGQMIWKNEHTDYLAVEAFAEQVRAQEAEKNKNRVSGMGSFTFASLGVDLDDILNKLHSDVDWNKLDQLKLARAIEYKQKVIDTVGMTNMNFSLGEIATFSEWLSKHFLNEQR